MIIASSESTPFLTRFSNGRQSANADATVEKGGGEAGFRPHELLEAALATCMNMQLRMYAANHGIGLTEVCTTVTLDRNSPVEAVFNKAALCARAFPRSYPLEVCRKKLALYSADYKSLTNKTEWQYLRRHAQVDCRNQRNQLLDQK